MTYDNWKTRNDWESMICEECHICCGTATCTDELGRPLCPECSERLDYAWYDGMIDYEEEVLDE
jgi:hypothetical protein